MVISPNPEAPRAAGRWLQQPRAHVSEGTRRDAAARCREICSTSESDDASALGELRSPFVIFFFSIFELSNVAGTHETFENEDLLPLGPQFGGWICTV